MRRYCEPHYHEIKLPSGRTIRTQNDCYKKTEEIGFLGPLLGAVAGPVIDTVGGALGLGGKKGKKSAPSPQVVTQAPVIDQTLLTDILDAVRQGISKEDVKLIVKELIRDTPPPVRNEVIRALKDYKLSIQKGKDISKDIANSVNPYLNSVLAILKEQNLQTQATYEHNKLETEKKRWANTEKQQKAILQKVNSLNSNLKNIEKKYGNISRALKINNITKASFGIPIGK